MPLAPGAMLREVCLVSRRAIGVASVGITGLDASVQSPPPPPPRYGPTTIPRTSMSPRARVDNDA